MRSEELVTFDNISLPQLALVKGTVVPAAFNILQWFIWLILTIHHFYFASSLYFYTTLFFSICVYIKHSLPLWHLLNFHLILSSYCQNTIFSIQMSATYIKSDCMDRDTALRVNRIEEFSERNMLQPWYPWFWYRVHWLCFQTLSDGAQRKEALSILLKPKPVGIKHQNVRVWLNSKNKLFIWS